MGTVQPAGAVYPAHRGSIDSFDKDVGLGEVRGADDRLYPFHCTEIVDGSRDIPVGEKVSFVVAPGHLGSWEARALQPLG